MTFFNLVLFLHVASGLLLFAALVFEAIALNRMRRAVTAEDARRWFDVAPWRATVIIGSAGVLFLTGGYMASQLSAWIVGWPRVAAMSLGLMGGIGRLTGRRLRAIERTSVSGDQSKEELLTRLRDPLLKISISFRIAMVLGITFLMVTTPDLLVSAVVMAIFAGLGLSWGFLSSRTSTAAAMPASEVLK
jgi:hypothetical protein